MNNSTLFSPKGGAARKKAGLFRLRDVFLAIFP